MTSASSGTPVWFALTFDDGPGPSTAALLDCLAEAGVRATFFILGANVEEARWCGGNVAYAESLVLRMLRDGHLVGNHTWSHMTCAQAGLDLPGFRTDLLRGEQVVRRLLAKAGRRSDGFVPIRLPFGPRPPAVINGQPESPIIADPRLAELQALGMVHAHWSAAFDDWDPLPGGELELCRRLCEHTSTRAARGRPAVLLLHDSVPPCDGASQLFDRSSTVEAVRRFLQHGHTREWSHFVFPTAHWQM